MELKQPVRVRMAPSPTGDAHVGHARTTLYNYLIAKQNHGTFILRIDDTDTKRNTLESEEGVQRGLRWLGLDWDEGPDKGGPHTPYRQSERLDIYHRYMQQLLDAGKAYECYCTPLELEAQRQAQQAAKQDIKYSGKCRHLSAEERARLRAEGHKPTIRLIAPDEKVGFHDLVRGWIEADGALMGDPIIVKSNGIPVYNFATVVDDHLMDISVVTRAAEHIANTFPQIFIYQALGWDLPQFAHFSVMLNEDHSKMSKRKGATFIGQYAEMGYLPEAMLNFLAFLGWSPGVEGDDEIMSMDDLLQRFSIERCTVSNAVFDIKKLDWINAKWVRRLEANDLAERLLPFLRKAGFVGEQVDMTHLVKLMPLVQERLPRLDAIVNFPYFFQEPEVPVEEIRKTLKGKDGVEGLNAVVEALTPLPWMEAELERATHQAQERLGWSTKELFMTVRLALSGGKVSPPLFASMEVLGRERTLARLQRAMSALAEQ